MMLQKAFAIPMTYVFLFSMLIFTACEKDDTGSPDEGAKGQLRIELTDAPTDDATVEGVFVTVAEVKVDGQKVESFQPKTIDISAYQEGKVMLLSDSEIAAKSYSSISLVLDHATDANGNAPGCYVLTTNGSKESLMAGAQDMTELTLSGKSFNVMEDQTSVLVIDFDLRKAVKRENDTSYDFVSAAELAASLRIVSKENTGTVEGQVANWDQHADQVIVYAYQKGSFNANTETQAQGESQLRFKNAVSSTQAKADGSFELHFLESGEYELFFAGYNDDDQDGRFELKGSLSIDLIGNLDLSTVNVEANSSTRLDLSVIGILPL